MSSHTSLWNPDETQPSIQAQMTIVKRRTQIQMAVGLIVIAPFWIPTQGQAKNQDAFIPVPVNLRARLIERLTLLVDYQRSQQWEKQYDLLSVLFTQGKGKEEFVKVSRDWYAQGLGTTLLDFTPKAVVVHSGSVDHGEWTIYGCAKVREKKRTVKLYASVDAHRENGDWFFSQVAVVTPIDGKTKPCPY